MIYGVYGKKKGKREPWYDSKGKLIDDGENIDILLNRSSDKARMEIFMENIKKNVDADQWTFWIDEYKN